MHTNAVGQFYYCAPEQFMMLKDGDKRSDVYSLGRVINFIMTGDPRDSHHIYRNIAEKATNSDAAYRYADAGQLSVLHLHNGMQMQDSYLSFLRKRFLISKKQKTKHELTKK